MGQFLAAGFSRLEPPRVVLPIEVELATPGDRASMLDDPAAAAAAGECEKLIGFGGSMGASCGIGSTFSSPSIKLVSDGSGLIGSTIRCWCRRVMRRVLCLSGTTDDRLGTLLSKKF